jgi:FkbM family methyltransferase
MGNKIIPIHSKDNHIYWVDAEDKLYIQRLKNGQYQGSNWVFAQTLINNWNRCIDVGSNNGCNAIHYAKQFNIVECFEPTHLAQQLWQNTIRDNNVQNVNLYTQGLAEENKSAEIVIHNKNGGHNHVENLDKPRWTGKKWIARNPDRKRKRQLQPIQLKTLDSYGFEDVGFIKIDVEGYEQFVLQGAQQTIQKSRPTIQLEIVAGQCRKFGYWGEDMIEWIRSWDYSVVSRKRGLLTGTFKSYRTQLLYNDNYYKGEMDLWFQPNERLDVVQQLPEQWFIEQ